MRKIAADKKIILDADVVIHFFKADKLTLLSSIFPNKLYLPDIVFEETKQMELRTQIQNQLAWGFINELTINLNGNREVFFEYIRLKKKGLGKGESACMAYCKYNKDVIASSNLRDIKDYCAENEISYLTTMDFLEAALHKQIMTHQECDQFITDVLSKGSKLPCKSMAEFANSKQK